MSNSTTYHEAGHAVMACLQKRVFKIVTIDPTKLSQDDNPDGYCTAGEIQRSLSQAYIPLCRPQIWREVDRKLLEIQAGPICEFYRNNSWKQYIFETQAKDMMDALELLKPHIKDETMRIKYMSHSYSWAVAILQNPLNMAYVKAVAEVLENEKTLTQYQVRVIMKNTKIEMDGSFGIDRAVHDDLVTKEFHRKMEKDRKAAAKKVKAAAKKEKVRWAALTDEEKAKEKAKAKKAAAEMRRSIRLWGKESKAKKKRKADRKRGEK